MVDYVQIKVAKDHYTLTMNLIIHTMKMYKTKKKDKIKQKVFIDNKENMIHSLNKKKKKRNKQNNIKQIKITRISYPKLLFWR